MSLRNAFKTKFKHEKDKENDKEGGSPAPARSPCRNFAQDELGLSQDDLKEYVEEDSSSLKSSRSEISEQDPSDELVGEQLKSIYEAQLTQLQEQLVAVMIENQQLLNELKAFKDEKKMERLMQDLEKEKEKERSRVLSEKCQEKEIKHRESPRLPRFVRKRSDKSKSFENTISLSCDRLSPEREDFVEVTKESVEEDIEQIDHSQRPEKLAVPPMPSPSRPQRWKGRFLSIIYEFLEDLKAPSEEEAEEDSEGDALTVKNLKENILRFGSASKPAASTLKGIMELLRWEAPSTTLMVFAVYMYSVYHGWLLPVILFLAIFRLFINYLKFRGWRVNITYFRRQENDELDKELGLSDKFQLVLQVARKVQNTFGKVADYLEKCKNLLTWQKPEATWQLFIHLCLAFISSCVLSTVTLFTLAGLYMGIKLFLIDYIYYRFPRIREKHDSSLRLWRMLPTDAQLEKLHTRAIINKHVLPPNPFDNTETNPVNIQVLSSENQSFCQLFSLPSSEAPLPSWQSGRRCTLINKEKSLAGAFKNGRLYLTRSFLCFERSKTPTLKNLIIPLEDITRFEKAKPYSWLPGGGMALEVAVSGSDKTYIFGAIYNRDEVYDSIVEVAKKANLTWACELTAQRRFSD